MSASSTKRTSYDPSREHLGKIYAKGLLGAAEAQGATDRVMEQLDSLIDDVLDQLPDLEQLLASPRIPLEDKYAIIDKAFAATMTKLLLHFLKVTARHGRLDCLRQIRMAARQLYNQLRGRVEVTVETARELDQQVRSQIENHLTASLGRQVELCCNVNPSLLGGLVVRVGDTVYDGSLSQRLEKMRSDTLDETTKLIRSSLQRFVTTDYARTGCCADRSVEPATTASHDKQLVTTSNS